MNPRPPDYVLRVKTKDANNRDNTRAGAAWRNPDQSITIRLNPAISLNYTDNYLITLFPNNDPKPE
jgi:hypothetical protein